MGIAFAGLHQTLRWRALVHAILVLCLTPFAVSCVAVDPPKSKELVQDNNWAPAVEYRPGKPPERKGDAAKSEDVLLIAALSGGAKRSAAFSYGVFSILDKATVDLLYEADNPSSPRLKGNKGILSELDILSAVSGGAFTASYYALHRDDIFKSKEKYECSFEHFLFEDTGANIWGMYLLPWKWGWAFDSSYGTNDVMASFYAKRLFSGDDDCSTNFKADSARKTVGQNGATYADLYNAYSKGSPFLILESTDITRGIAFPYHQDSFDLLCSDISTFPLAWALAGSNAFPVVLSTVGLKNHHAGLQGLAIEDICRPDGNNWLKNVVRRTVGPIPGEKPLSESEETRRRKGCVPVEEFIDEAVINTGLDEKFFRSQLLPHVASCYVWPGEANYTHLADGGMTDNFALKGLTDWFSMHSADLEFAHLMHVTRRILVFVIDGQRDIDPIISKKPEGPDASAAIDSMISNGVDQGNVASLSDTMALLDTISKILEIRDLVVAERAWERARSTAGAVPSGETFEGFLKESNAKVKMTPDVFESEFDVYRAEVRALESQAAGSDVGAKGALEKLGKTTGSNVGAMGALEKLNIYTGRLSKDWGTRQIGDWFGSITIEDKEIERIISKQYGSVDKFWKEYSKIKKNLQLLASWRRKRVVFMTRLLKMSIVDDCNTDRQRKLLSSSTGLGIEKADIELAIGAGQDVALRHLPGIKEFVESGTHRAMLSCEHWLGKTSAEEGGDTAKPEVTSPSH